MKKNILLLVIGIVLSIGSVDIELDDKRNSGLLFSDWQLNVKFGFSSAYACGFGGFDGNYVEQGGECIEEKEEEEEGEIMLIWGERIEYEDYDWFSNWVESNIAAQDLDANDEYIQDVLSPLPSPPVTKAQCLATSASNHNTCTSLANGTTVANLGICAALWETGPGAVACTVAAGIGNVLTTTVCNDIKIQADLACEEL